MIDLAAVVDEFIRFSAGKASAYSPTYADLARRMSDDTGLLALAANAVRRPPVDLFFAAVQFLARRQEATVVRLFDTGSTCYPSAVAAFQDLRGFCLDNAAELADILRTRWVQTNEPRRSTALLLGLHEIAARCGDTPIHLVELGTSAGVLLTFDCYDFRLTRPDGTVVHLAAARRPGPPPPTIQTDIVGAVDRIPGRLPHIASRTGVEANPIDLNDPDARLWLESFIWPEEYDRRRRLRAALAMVAADQPRIIAGDMADRLPGLLDELPDGLICVFHSHSIKQASADSAARLDKILTEMIATGRGVRLFLEGRWRNSPRPVVHAATGTYAGLGVTDTAGDRWLGVAGSRGNWVELR